MNAPEKRPAAHASAVATLAMLVALSLGCLVGAGVVAVLWAVFG